MRAFAALAASILVATAISGCTNPAVDLPADVPGPSVTVDPVTGEELFLKPNLTAGRWWNAHLAVDYGNDFLYDIKGRIIVGRQDSSGFVLGADNQDFGTFDTYFDSFYHGALDADLNPIIKGQAVKFFEWPLKDSLTWKADLPAQDFNTFSEVIYPATFNVTRVTEESRPDLAPRVRIRASTPGGITLDYDYSARTGWMSYFRMLNQTTGQVIISVDFAQTGPDYAGEVHVMTQEVLYERFRFTPPFAPEFAPVPPVETVTVAGGYEFVDEIMFLFTVPIVAAGAGEVVVNIARPDGSIDPHTHTGAGDQFQGTFNRTTVFEGTEGEWHVAILPAGTGGAFVGLYGLRDDVLRL